jgi:hypothetical protein
LETMRGFRTALRIIETPDRSAEGAEKVRKLRSPAEVYRL